MANKSKLEEANKKFVAEFSKEDGAKPMPPARKLLVLACMDARLHVAKFLGLSIGDAHIVRNAGGRASPDALRSMAISQRLLGTNEIAIVHHTDCGMLTFKDSEIRAKITTDLGAEAGKESERYAFLPFSNVEDSVKEDIAIIKAAKIVDPKTPIYGYVYDVKTGALREVK